MSSVSWAFNFVSCSRTTFSSNRFGQYDVFVVPAVPYLQALDLKKDDLVQALGLSFTTSTIALAAGLASHGAFQLTSGGASLLCTVPALAVIINAVVDALSDLGVRHVEMPATPERVWRAIQEARG